MRQTSAAEYAFLAEDVYRDSARGSHIMVWERRNFYGDPSNGFFAATYRTPRTKKTVVAFRGTQEGVDWLHNIGNTVGTASLDWNSQLNTALSYFRAARHNSPNGNLAVCGHSLGGFLATMVALDANVPAVTFNAAPLGGSGLGAKVRSLLGQGPAPRIVDYRLKGDVVSGLRRYNIGRVVELQLSAFELWARKPGVWGDLDPVMHAMSLMKEAILRHRDSDKPPEAWAA